MGLGGPAEIDRQAYAASAGQVARFYKHVWGWAERQKLLARLRNSQHIIALSASLNDDLRALPNGEKLLLNPAQMEMWPSQSALSRALIKKRADKIEEQLSRDDSVMASWFASNRLKYASGWLNAIPSLPVFRVSSQVFQIMLCLRVLAPIPGMHDVRQCQCGYDYRPLLRNGVHFLSSCDCHSYTSYRHNAILPILRRLFAELRRVVQEGEMANWLAGARAKRPFDICAQTPPDPEAQQGHIGNRPEWIGYDIGVADPKRVGRLPAGTPYYQKGRASYRLQNRKNSKFRSDVRYFGPLTQTVGYVPLVFEFSGGFGPTAVEEFAGWAKEAAEKVRKSGSKLSSCRTAAHMECDEICEHVQSDDFVCDCAGFRFVDSAGCGESRTTRRGSWAAQRDLNTDCVVDPS